MKAFKNQKFLNQVFEIGEDRRFFIPGRLVKTEGEPTPMKQPRSNILTAMLDGFEFKPNVASTMYTTHNDERLTNQAPPPGITTEKSAWVGSLQNADNSLLKAVLWSSAREVEEHEEFKDKILSVSFLRHLKDEFGQKKLADHGSSYIRAKLRETSFAWQVLPATAINGPIHTEDTPLFDLTLEKNKQLHWTSGMSDIGLGIGNIHSLAKLYSNIK